MKHLYKTLAANAPAHPQDVLAAKSFLKSQGFYAPPAWGITPFPDRALFTAVRAFQKSNDLRVDGVMKPQGATATAIRAQAARPEFSVAGQDKGLYIWRTISDGKVRSSHADREGKRFSWDHPPAGGHPGEAYNCRCWTEEAHSDFCAVVPEMIREARKAIEKLQIEYNQTDQGIKDLHHSTRLFS